MNYHKLIWDEELEMYLPQSWVQYGILLGEDYEDYLS